MVTHVKTTTLMCFYVFNLISKHMLFAPEIYLKSHGRMKVLNIYFYGVFYMFC